VPKIQKAVLFWLSYAPPRINF